MSYEYDRLKTLFFVTLLGFSCPYSSLAAVGGADYLYHRSAGNFAPGRLNWRSH